MEEPQLSMTTLVEISDLIGFAFGKNSYIRNEQNEKLAKEIQESTSQKIPLEDKDRFFLGAIDFLVQEKNEEKTFHFLEVNGSGIGSVTNISNYAFNEILETFEEIPRNLLESKPLIVMAYSDSRKLGTSLPRGFIFEKFFFVEAMKKTIKRLHGNCTIYSLNEAERNKDRIAENPSIVIGYQYDLINKICIKENQAYLFDNRISCLINDSVCAKIAQLSNNNIDIFYVNDLFSIFTDKAKSYKAYNNFLKGYKCSINVPEIGYSYASNYDELVEKCMSLHQKSKNIVIKPNMGCVGYGVEFLFTSDSPEEIIDKIKISLSEVQSSYSNNFPYTISDYIDSSPIKADDNPLHGYKYDLRLVLYQHKNELRCFPSVIRAARKRYDRDKIDKQMLLNYASTPDSKVIEAKYKYSLPLCNKKTLDLILLNEFELKELSSLSINFIQYLLETTRVNRC